MSKKVINYSNSSSEQSIDEIQVSIGNKRKINYSKISNLLQKHQKLDEKEDFQPKLIQQQKKQNKSILGLSQPLKKSYIPNYALDKKSEDDDQQEKQTQDELQIKDLDQFNEKPKEKNFKFDDQKMIQINATDLLDFDWMKARAKEKIQKEIRGFQPIMAPNKTEQNKHQLQSLAYDAVQNIGYQEEIDLMNQNRKKNTQMRYGW